MNWTGKLLKAGAAYYGNTSILVAETRALHDGLNLAIQVESDHLIVEGDNKAIEGKIHIPWQIHYIIEDIQAWRNQGIQIVTNHAFK